MAARAARPSTSLGMSGSRSGKWRLNPGSGKGGGMDKKFLGGGLMLGILFGVIFDNLALGILFGLIFGGFSGKLMAGNDPHDPKGQA